MINLLCRILLLSAMITLLPGLITCPGVNAADKAAIAGRPVNEAVRTGLANELSSLNVAIEISATELGAGVNRLTPKELYRGAISTNGLSAVILRNGPILVTAADDYIYLTVPITISISSSLFETSAIAARLKFKVNARVTPDWKISADVYYIGLSEPLPGEIVIGPLSIKPRSMVEGLARPLQRTLSDLLSRKLNEKFPLKARAAKVWHAAQQPILLNGEYNAWLLLSPREVLLYPFYARDNRIKLVAGLTCFAGLVVGPAPAAGLPLPLPDLKPARGTAGMFRVSLHTELFYRDIVRIASPQLLNKELGSDGNSIILTGLDLYGNGDRLIIKAATTGTFEGTIYLSGRPVFNPQTNMFSVEDVDFALQTRDVLMQSAVWFLQSAIRSTIQEKLSLDLTTRLEQIRVMAGKALSRVVLAENVLLVSSISSMALNDLMVQQEKISIQFYAEGETAIVFH